MLTGANHRFCGVGVGGNAVHHHQPKALLLGSGTFLLDLVFLGTNLKNVFLSLNNEILGSVTEGVGELIIVNSIMPT